MTLNNPNSLNIKLTDINTFSNDVAKENAWGAFLSALVAPKLNVPEVKQPQDNFKQWYILTSSPVVNAAKSLDELIGNIKSMRGAEIYTTDAVSSAQTDGVNQILNSWVTDIYNYGSLVLKQLNTIKNNLDEPKPYTDPQQEILARQDVDQRLKMVDKSELVNYIQSRLNGDDTGLPTVSKYELNEFKIALKQQFDAINAVNINMQISQYESANFEPWLKDSAWGEYATRLRELQSLNSMFGLTRPMLMSKQTNSWDFLDGQDLNNLIATETMVYPD